MKKFFTLLLLTVLTVTSAMAVRPKPGRFFVKTQSDGTQIVVERLGDGHNGVVFYRTQDDLVLVQNADGDLCYATPQGNRLRASAFIAHAPQYRSASETAFLQTASLNSDQACDVVATRARKPQVNRISSGTSSRKDGLGTYGQTAGGAVSSLGEFTMPVIMVEFSDVKFQSTTTKAVLTRQYNEEGYTDANGSVGSTRDYFIAQSRGMFRPKFEVAAKVTLSNTRKHYGRDNGEDEIDVNIDDFMNDALSAAVTAGVDFSKYVYQGGVPCVILLYAGQGEANSYEDEASDFLWPCEWDQDEDFTLGGKTVHINSFFIGNEIQYDYEALSYNSRTGEYTYGKVGDPYLEGIGTFCHEFGHALGLPDFYCTNYNHSTTTLDMWDIMDMGSYLGDGYTPIGHTAYEKCFLGWLELRELTEAETVTLRPYESMEGDHAVIVRNDKDFKEYYIFENRMPGTWYPEDMSGGMFALHVTFDATAWTENTLNNNANKLRMQVFAADGSVDSYYSGSPDYLSDIFPGSKNITKATNNGTPAMKAFTGTYMNKPIYCIAVDGENVIFNFLQEEISTLQPGDTFVADGLNYEVSKSGEVYVIALESGFYAGDVVIPATVSYDNATWKVVGIRSGAFSGCDALTSLTIGSKVADIESGAMRNTPALTALSVAEGNGNYETLYGALYTKHIGGTASEDHGVLFDFANNTPELPLSTNSDQTAGNFSGPLTYEGVTLTATDGSTPTRMWDSGKALTMRIYKGGTFTFSVPEGAAMTSITFTTSNKNCITEASTGTLNGDVWTGSAQTVTFTNNNNGNTFVSSISVSVEGLAAATPWTLVKAPSASGTFDVPADVLIVADYALEAAGYTAVTLPTTLTTLGADALSMPTLTRIVANATVPAQCTADPFTLVNKQTCELYVPEGSLEGAATDGYRNAQYWKDFYSIQPITTAIAPVWAHPAQQASWFDLQGRRVFRLQRGVYIINGKKVVR